MLKLKIKVHIYKKEKRKIMKKLSLILSILLFTSSAFAGSCPMMAKGVDAKIAEAQKLRDAGMKAHESGDHAKSEELLGKALEMFKG